MAASEWSRSVQSIRDTLIADYSAPGANMTHRIAYHPLMAVSLVLLSLSVSYCEWTPWHCGQLWPYIGMGSLGTSEKYKLVRKPHAGFHTHKSFRLSYSSLLQSQDLLPHNIARISEVSLYIYIRWIWPQMVVEHNRWRTWRRPLRAPRDAPLGGRGGDTTKLDGSEPTIMIPPHVSRHPNRICEKERF